MSTSGMSPSHLKLKNVKEWTRICTALLSNLESNEYSRQLQSRPTELKCGDLRFNVEYFRGKETKCMGLTPLIYYLIQLVIPFHVFECLKRFFWNMCKSLEIKKRKLCENQWAFPSLAYLKWVLCLRPRLCNFFFFYSVFLVEILLNYER